MSVPRRFRRSFSELIISKFHIYLRKIELTPLIQTKSQTGTFVSLRKAINYETL